MPPNSVKEKIIKMERKKRLTTVGENSRHGSLLSVLSEGGYSFVGQGEGSAVILPMPYSADGVCVTGTEIPFSRLLSELPAGVPVLGGRFDRAAYLAAQKYGTRLFDYFTPEWVQVENAALTARGAVELAAERLQAGTKVLVCGFGRIGKCLMRELEKTGVDATVSLRKKVDAAWAKALGYRWVQTETLDPSPYRVVFNTVPAPVLGARAISGMERGSAIYDLSSPPYGVDFGAAEKQCVVAVTAPGLPGRMYPALAGRVLGESAIEILGQVLAQ